MALVVIVIIAVVAVRLLSGARLGKRWEVPTESVVIPSDSAAIAHGGHIAALLGCAGCHGEQLEGRIFVNTPSMGRIWARNLTRGEGGAGARYEDADWIRAIRHAVDREGRGLLFMPSQNYQRLNERDFGALIAWLKSRPPVDAALPPPELTFMARLFLLTGSLPLITAERLDHAAPRAAAVPPGPTAAYGAYLAGGCIGCHGEGFSGGAIPGGANMLPARNLTPDPATGIGKWSFDDFRVAMRTGQLPEGVVMDSVAMPIGMSREFTDEELAALFAYFRSLPPRPYGGR